MAQVQVRLRAVLGDEDLPVLVGAHGAGVHIDIGVELLVPHPEAPLLQKPPQGRRADALAQTRHHAAGDKYKFCFHDAHLAFFTQYFLVFYTKLNPPNQRLTDGNLWSVAKMRQAVIHWS